MGMGEVEVMGVRNSLVGRGKETGERAGQVMGNAGKYI